MTSNFRVILDCSEILSMQIFTISKNAGSTAPLGNLFQCSAALTVWLFFPSPLLLYLLLTFLLLLMNVASHLFVICYPGSGSVLSWNTFGSVRQQVDPSLALLLLALQTLLPNTSLVYNSPASWLFGGAPACFSPVPHLSRGTEHWTQHSSCSLRSAKCRRMIISLHLVAVLLLIQPGRLLALSAASDMMLNGVQFVVHQGLAQSCLTGIGSEPALLHGVILF